MAAGEEIQQIKDRLNIVDVVGQYVQLRRAGRTYTARCPFHKERTPSFHVSPERGTYKCFGCGEGGDIFTFVEKMENVDFVDALKQLAERAGVKLERRSVKPIEEVEKTERLIQICNDAAEFFKTELRGNKTVQGYLKTRGLEERTTEDWNIGYAPAMWDALSHYLLNKNYSEQDIIDSGLSVKSDRTGKIFDRFRGRVMFPISDTGGKIIAFSGRFFEKIAGQKDDVEPAKYINSPETLIFKKSRTLYGYDKAHGSIRKVDHTLLVEGQFDVVLCHQAGLSNTVALSGTALTEEHLSRLGRLSKRLKLALDADNAGIRAGLKSAQMAYHLGFEVKIPSFPQGKDPADIAKDDPQLLIATVASSKSAIEFFFDYLLNQKKPEREQKLEARKLVLPLIASIKNNFDQDHFIHIASQKLSVLEEVIRAEVKELVKTPISGTYDASPEVHSAGAQSQVSPLHKKVGMVLFGWADGRTQLAELLGQERLQQIEDEVSPLAETLRFEFDREVGEHSDEATIASDMISQIRTAVVRERYKMKAL